MNGRQLKMKMSNIQAFDWAPTLPAPGTGCTQGGTRGALSKCVNMKGKGYASSNTFLWRWSKGPAPTRSGHSSRKGRHLPVSPRSHAQCTYELRFTSTRLHTWAGCVRKLPHPHCKQPAGPWLTWILTCTSATEQYTRAGKRVTGTIKRITR